MNPLGIGYPTFLQATLASSTPQESSHTVPQIPLTQTSTLPWESEELPLSRTFPCVHAEYVQQPVQ